MTSQQSFNLPPISDRQLRQQALTHRSYCHEHPEANHNERLEFLGDAVLGFVVGELLYREYPQLSEAELTRLRSQLVDEIHLAALAQRMALGSDLRLSRGTDNNGGRERASILSDAFEALLGAYLLESGISAVRQYLTTLMLPIATDKLAHQKTATWQFLDPKSQLQQKVQAVCNQFPQYEMIGESGPDHAKVFTVQVRIQGKVYGQGSGRRKQEAQKQAAIAALQQLEKTPLQS